MKPHIILTESQKREPKMVALIPKIKKFLEKNPQTLTLYGAGFFLSLLLIAGGLYLANL